MSMKQVTSSVSIEAGQTERRVSSALGRIVMTNEFSKSLEAVLRRVDRGRAPPVAAAPPKRKTPDAEELAARRQKWFADLVAEQVMPLLKTAADAAQKHGATASCRLGETDGRLTAALTVHFDDLPKGANPPRLTCYLADGEPPIMVEFTGTFPHVGALGGFGAEIDYDPVYPSQIEAKILEFMALVSGAGAPLT
jgi:hypothetical protein